MAPEGLPHVVRFPRACPKCAAVTAMPLKAGTLSEARTRVDLQCDDCRHEWSIEVAPPVLIVRPDRETDGDPSGRQTPIAGHAQRGDRRDAFEVHRQRMRDGLCGLLTSPDRTQTVPVLYSLDAHQTAGRLRPMDPSSVFPAWLAPGSRLWLSAYDGVALRIRISVVKRRAEAGQDDEQFAAFAVPPVAH